MQLILPESSDKDLFFKTVEDWAGGLSLKIAGSDKKRPWGGSIYIDTSTSNLFLSIFFPELHHDEIFKYGSDISPKFMLFEPHQMLSWQYHNRRAEIWKIVKGPVNVLSSQHDDIPAVPTKLKTDEITKHQSHIRHRLVALEERAVVAEIWQHTVAGQPSDEEDIVRLQDAYGRG